jgi:hypothetical protein
MVRSRHPPGARRGDGADGADQNLPTHNSRAFSGEPSERSERPERRRGRRVRCNAMLCGGNFMTTETLPRPRGPRSEYVRHDGDSAFPWLRRSDRNGRPGARRAAEVPTLTGPSRRITVGRSAASRASKASGPSECEGGESAATPC